MPSIPKFTKGGIAWAVVTAISMVLFAYTLLIWFGVDDLPWFFEHNSGATIAVRLISLLVLATCMVFQPSDAN